MGKYLHLKDEAVAHHLSNPNNSISESAREFCKLNNFEYSDSFRKRLSEWVNLKIPVDITPESLSFDNETLTETNQYKTEKGLSALRADGTLMDIDEYCTSYGIPRAHVKSYKLLTYLNPPCYNIASENLGENDCEITVDELKQLLQKELESIIYEPKTDNSKNGVIVVSLADLHFGAYVDNLIKTKQFSITVLIELLTEAATIINNHCAKEVHVHILGDLIESWTGLNHINSWKGLQKGMIGAEVVKFTTKILHETFLSKITNLLTVKIIAGNHDRSTSAKDEDTDGDAANLISWGLSLIGYSVEFHPFVLTHLVDDINHILLHGHDIISKKSTKDICWDYGVQGKFNFITEGHLHSTIEKLSIAQRKTYKTIKDDAVDHRRMNCPSLFTGNSHSERLGFTSNSGFIISENNGKGIPHVYFYAL